MELRDLKTFVTVATLLSFNGAGRVEHAAQSTVSTRIKTLEDELGVRLFDRLGRRVLLTEAGARLLDYAHRLVETEEEARVWVSGASGAHGVLRVRLPETLCVRRAARVLKLFRARCPEVRLRLFPCVFEGLSEDLRRGVSDLAFVLANEVLSRDIQADFLGVEELVLAACPGHRLARRKGVEPADLAEEPLLLSTADCSYRRILESLLARAGNNPVPAVECGSVEAVKRFAMAGLGITILPKSAATAELEAGTLAALPWADGPLEAAVLMLRHRDKWISPALAAFMEVCRAELLH